MRNSPSTATTMLTATERRDDHLSLPDFASEPLRPSPGLYWRSLRPLKHRQLFALVRRRIAGMPALPRASPVQPKLREIARAPSFPEWQPERALRMLESNEFTFLNASSRLGDRLRWQIPGRERLWLYHLNCFDFLNLDFRSPARHAHLGAALDLACDWCSGNTTGQETGWEPYPLSIRIVNWIKFLVRNAPACESLGRGEAAARLLAGIRWQTLALERRLEEDVRANHLVKNAKALLFSGALLECPESSRWLRRGESLLRREIAEQVLRDGGHFERSPLYHTQVLDDLLDLEALCVSTGGMEALREALREPGARMAGFLRGILHPDGEIPLFNDSAFGMAVPAGQVLKRAGVALGCSPGVLPSVAAFAETGYVALRDPAAGSCLLFDCGPLGPACQPGHGHCDVLSYELSLRHRRVVVDTGVSTYERGAERQYERSTAAHSTLRIDGQEQAEIWAAFRAGRRPRVSRVETGELHGCDFARAEHFGYAHRGVIHRRSVFHVPDDRWLIADAVRGRGKHRVESFIHFHPDVAVERANGNKPFHAPEGGQAFLIRLGNIVYWLATLGRGDLILKQSWYAPEMGVRRGRAVLHWSVDASLPASLICVFSPADAPAPMLRFASDGAAVEVNGVTLPVT